MSLPLAMKNLFSSLTGRFILGALAINLTLMPLFLFGINHAVERALQTSFIDRVRLDAHFFAETVAQSRDPALIREMLDDAMMSGRYVRAVLVETSPEQEETRKVETFQEDFFFGQGGDQIYHIAVPLPLNEDFESNFVLQLGYDETPVNEQIQEITRLCLYLAGIFLFLTLLASVIFGVRIMHPLRELRNTARAIASGGYDRALDVDTGISEIASLAGDFETMRRELVRHNKELEYQSLHDALTGLPNRVLLQDRLRQAIHTAQREDRPLALFMIDLDGFKSINDTLGHHYGDLLLQQVASRIKGVLRKSDTIARFGGDEFCILLPTITDARHATDIAGKIATTLEQPFFFEDQPYQVGLSIGIALYPEHGADSGVLMRHADVAMYIAKQNNLDYTIYDASQDQNNICRLSLMWDLRKAIENGDLHLDYQPIVDLHDGRIDAVEALVRWDHPQRGLVMPEEFIALAEQTNLIKPLTIWILTEAVHQCADWQGRGYDFRVAVNLSPRNLHEHDHPRQLMDIIEREAIDPAGLTLELTERAIISEPKGTRKILDAFHAMGVNLALDDFGTGYSSLGTLKKLPLSAIKIDKSFVMDLNEHKDSLTLVRAIIDLAHNLGLQVIAEGVASREIMHRLKSLGCDQAQGYFIARPLSPAGLECWLRDEDKGKTAQD